MLKAKYQILQGVKGVGLMSFAVVVAETDGFALFTNSRQLTSHSGYDIVENQSGKRSGKTRIVKKGNTHIRGILNMPALNVVRHDPYFKSFYERVYSNTQIKMKAYTAVQRKLLCLMYTLWNNNQPYDPLYNHQDKLSEVNG
ncbi:MAG TPA: IS110 family transposase [Cytophagales bacterium]|nr:IS110 family transposase [Cytophagales bacterium]